MSKRDDLAQLRSQYSGEHPEAAKAAVTRTTSLCLDECADGQRELRDLFAWWIFNSGGYYTGIPGINSYTPTFSPRYNELVIVNSAPHNIGARLVPHKPIRMQPITGTERVFQFVPRDEEELLLRGLPGLRVTASMYETVEFRHLLSGGRLTVTEHANRGPWPRADEEPMTRWYSDALWSDVPLTAIERARIEHCPRLPKGVKALLRALLVRMEFTDPQRRWAASWFWDPFKRWKNQDPSDFGDGFARRVTGSGRRWRLEWTGYPYAADLAAMLTDPIAGVAGTIAERRGHEAFDVAFRGAVLELRPIRHTAWPDVAELTTSSSEAVAT